MLSTCHLLITNSLPASLDQIAKWGKTMNIINMKEFPTCLAPPHWAKYTHTPFQPDQVSLTASEGQGKRSITHTVANLSVMD